MRRKTHTPALTPVINETLCRQKHWGSVHNTVSILQVPNRIVKGKWFKMTDFFSQGKGTLVKIFCFFRGLSEGSLPAYFTIREKSDMLNYYT